MRTTEAVRCPETGCDADLTLTRELKADWSPGRRTDVARCSLLADPDNVNCDKPCLAQGETL